MNKNGKMKAVLEDSIAAIERALKERKPAIELSESGMVTFVGSGIARIKGLPGVEYDEIVLFEDDTLGIAFTLEPDNVGIILLKESVSLEAGADVRRAGRILDVPVGEELLGRVVNGVGEPLDSKGPILAMRRLPVEREAAAIMDRAPVTEPLLTGLKVIDALIPIGKGQRELILGDRQTGKTAIAVDTIINQRGKDVICIYCAIGQRLSSVAKVIDDIRRNDAMQHTIILVAAGEDPPGLQFIAPYAATSMGEYFMEKGRDVLIIYDDLTRHAWAYRQLSLLLRRPPGREAYPGDIFYIHSRLLERSTHLNKELGGGSLTALPIIETEAQNVAAYIPTNLISITDGQIYLSPLLFQKGMMPAVDVGKSVSRVGGKTQYPAYLAVAGELKLSYAQFEELEKFSRFSTRLDENTLKTLERGRRVREILKQHQYDPKSPAEQTGILLAVTSGIFDGLKLEDFVKAENELGKIIREEFADLQRKITSGEKLPDEDINRLMEAANRAAANVKGAA
ncbi:MAG: alternate F1F0 ATPase, F1 subunit alpha [Nitrospiraceae bacterium]|nr:alternate F1F0 ATPase, F1 subunit alpha [Nitrospiraceae bacterium]